MGAAAKQHAARQLPAPPRQPLLRMPLLLMAAACLVALHLVPTAAQPAGSEQDLGGPLPPRPSVAMYFELGSFADTVAAYPPWRLGQQGSPNSARLAGPAIRTSSLGAEEEDEEETRHRPAEGNSRRSRRATLGVRGRLLSKSSLKPTEGFGSTSRQAPGVVAPVASRLVWKTAGMSTADAHMAHGGLSEQDNDPPEPTMCVGGGYVIQAVKGTIRMFNATSGKPVADQLDLNTFYGYDTAVGALDQSSGEPQGPFGPYITRPTCLFDPDNKLFYLVAHVQPRDPTTGSRSVPGESINIAVSKGSDPTKGWMFYKLSIRNDGQDDSSVHEHCLAEACTSDRVRVGLDAYGLYIASDELDAESFRGTNFFAIDKVSLANGNRMQVVEWFAAFEEGVFGVYYVQPSVVPASAPAPRLGKTYFAATFPTLNGTFCQDSLAVLTMSDTSLLSAGKASAWAQMRLTVRRVSVGPYTYPRDLRFTAPQPDGGSNPAGADVYNPDTEATGYPVHPVKADEGQVASVVYARKKLYITFDSLFLVSGVLKVGPVVVKLTADVALVPDNVWSMTVPGSNSAMYPTLAVNANGVGVLGFLLVGTDYNPSAAYVTLNANGLGPLRLAYRGKGPYDNYNYYLARSVGEHPNMHWGRHSASAVDDRGHLYFTHEVITQTCDLYDFTYSYDLYGRIRCHGTRMDTVNWGTSLSKVKVWRGLPGGAGK